MGRYGYVKRNLRYIRNDDPLSMRIECTNPSCEVYQISERGTRRVLLRQGRDTMSHEFVEKDSDYVVGLEERVRQLESREPKVERIIEITPTDYECLKRENRKMELQIQKYRQLLTIGEMSSLSQLIDQYIESSKKQLKKLSAEIHMTNFDKSHIQQVLHLVDHLSGVQKELCAAIAMYAAGKYESNSLYEKIDADIRQINTMLSTQTDVCTIPETRLEEFHQTLLCMIEVIGGYLHSNEQG